MGSIGNGGPPRRRQRKRLSRRRFGDIGLLIGIIIAYLNTGTFDIREVIAALSGGEAALVAFLLFLGAMGKSAQFPFHIWLPDAMEGPTPVSALIHAATMVAAGVFLVARMFDLFVEAPAVLWFVAVIGLGDSSACRTPWRLERSISSGYSPIRQ